MPSVHVWSNFGSPASPQFMNQAPPRAQQLRLPDFLVIPHLRHTVLTIADADIASRGFLVPDRTNFGYGLLVQERNRYIHCIVNVQPAIAAHCWIPGMPIVVDVLAETSATGLSNVQKAKTACDHGDKKIHMQACKRKDKNTHAHEREKVCVCKVLVANPQVSNNRSLGIHIICTVQQILETDGNKHNEPAGGRSTLTNSRLAMVDPSPSWP